MNELKYAKDALDSLIKKGRVHLYKPIQIAEILRKDRIEGGLNLLDKDTYRKESKKWRDIVTQKLVGNISTSSARYQDNLFEENAIPPRILNILSQENRRTSGAVEAYIYKKLKERLKLLTSGINYCCSHNKKNFQLREF